MARMKLILTQEVDGLGAPGDVVDVAAGYGRNYLLPRGFGITWTRGGEKQVDLIKRARAAREIRTMEDAQAVVGRLQKLTVRVKRRAGSNGRLFGSVGASDIAAALKDAGGPEIDKRTIVVPDPIKSAGAYRVQVRLHPEVTASVNVEVSAE
jgi:large subunit ribosomal protein L9